MSNNNVTLTLESLLKRLSKAQAWEIKDPLLNQVIANNKTHSDINSAISEIKSEYAGQQILVKAGNVDKNGNVASNARTFSLVIPRENTGETVILQPQPNNNNGQIIYTGLGGVQQNINPENFAQALGELEKRLSEKFDVELKKTALELEYTYKLSELERREKELAKKEKEIERLKKEYEAKTQKIFPAIKDIGNAVLNGLIFGDKEETEKDLKDTPRKLNDTVDFKFKDEETGNKDISLDELKEKLEQLSEEEKDALFEEFFDFETEEETDQEAPTEPEPINNAPENEMQTIKTK